ncbi:MAG: general secretion pathway protein GspJ [Bdellovibrio sp.]|nr:MAG: general secretion pathway protein GspJ [Bdellovibrio sp.]
MKKSGWPTEFFTPALGFTMLEILIVLALLSFLTINIAVTIRNGFKTRIKVQQQVEDMSQVRDALRVIQRDLSQAFHYRDLEEEFRAELKKATTGGTSAVAGIAGSAPPPDPKEQERKQNRQNPVTQFVGHDNEMYFATENGSRMSADLKQADFIKVGYSLRSCRRPGSEESSQCVIRKSSPFVEGDITRGGVDVVLISDVSEFKLRYFGNGKQDWVTDWDSTASDSVTQNAYPAVVEVSLAIERGKEKKKKIFMQSIVEIHFPNNEEKSGAAHTTPSSGFGGESQ